MNSFHVISFSHNFEVGEVKVHSGVIEKCFSKLLLVCWRFELL